MSLIVQFGNGGAPTLASLANPGNVADVLDSNATVSETSVPGGSQISTTTQSVAGVSGGGAGGNVNVGYLGAGAYSFDVAGDWNSVKNALATSDSAAHLVFKDFVQVDVSLGGTGDSSVEIDNVKRGNVTTGSGNDTINVSLLSNDNTWVNTFNVNSGVGNDTIVFHAGDSNSAGNGVGSWIVGAAAVSGGHGVTDGSATSAYIDAGAGNDNIDLSGVHLKSATIIGGTGVDHIVASQGADTFFFHQGDTGATLGTADVITQFGANDKLQLYGNAADWSASYTDGENIVSNSVTHEKIIIDGVDLQHSTGWLVV